MRSERSTVRTWLRRASPGLGVGLLLGGGEQPGPQDAHGRLLVLQLALLVLAAGDDAGRHVRDAHGGVGRVDALPARAAAAVDVDAQVVVVDLDVDLLGLGHHQDAGRAGVDPALRLGDRHPLDAVHPALELEQGERGLAGLGRALGLDRDGDRLVAAQVGLGRVDHLDRPAALLGVAGVHAQQVAGEQGRLLAALARLHLEQGVVVVGGVARHQQPAQPLLGDRQPRGDGLGLLGERRVLRGELARGPEVVAERRPVAPGADDRAQLGVAAVELLGQARVGVRLGRGEPPLELVVLGEHALDGFEHGDSPRSVTRRRCGHETSAGPRDRDRRSIGSYLDSASAGASVAAGAAFL